ncbi:hypothetical protein CBS101457_001368 [Exobasidium rhododendri]|nr:hypothetical protein CBS101457_001368 [Exobasidium rhododendri]
MGSGKSDSGWDETLQHLASLRTSGLALLDGGFATHLEDALGQDISSSSLWSASLIESEEGSKAIIQTHLDFLRAGADVVSTSTYQASDLAFRMAGQTSERAERLLIKSVQLAQQAREDYARSQPSAGKPLLLLSLGPYGSALSNGCEYTGDYFVPDVDRRIFDGPAASLRDVEDFHYTRLRTIASSPVWSCVDVIAFETIPRLDEAAAIRNALQRLFREYTHKLSYTSFVFPKGLHLPWPVQENEDADQDMAHLLEVVLGDDRSGQPSPLDGVGINCTKPRFLNRLVANMTSALAQVKRSEKSYLFVSRCSASVMLGSTKRADVRISSLLQLYPDGGLVWDGINRVWTGGEENAESSTLSWCDLVMEAAKVAKGSMSPWGGCFVGGCCKATSSDIAALRARLDVQ